MVGGMGGKNDNFGPFFWVVLGDWVGLGGAVEALVLRSALVGIISVSLIYHIV